MDWVSLVCWFTFPKTIYLRYAKVESVIARILVATRCITIEKKSSEISGQKVFVGHFIQPRVHCLLKISEWLFSTDHPRFRCPLPLARKTRETEHGVYTCPPIPLSSEILFLNSIHHFGDCSSCTHKSFCHTFLKAQEKKHRVYLPSNIWGKFNYYKVHICKGYLQ